MQILWVTIACSIASSIFYRAGGLSKEQPYWIPVWLRRSWVRDWLCPLFVLLPLFIQHPHWAFIPVYGLLGASLTTYWDWLYKNTDNFWLSGFFSGLSIMPLVLAGFIWWVILLKAVILALLWGGLCAIFGNDHVEEHGRGAFLSVLSV